MMPIDRFAALELQLIEAAAAPGQSPQSRHTTRYTRDFVQLAFRAMRSADPEEISCAMVSAIKALMSFSMAMDDGGVEQIVKVVQAIAQDVPRRCQPKGEPKGESLLAKLKRMN